MTEPAAPDPGDEDRGHLMSDAQWADVEQARAAYLASLGDSAVLDDPNGGDDD